MVENDGLHLSHAMLKILQASNKKTFPMATTSLRLCEA